MRIGGKIGVGVAVLGLVLSTAQAAGAAPPPDFPAKGMQDNTVTLVTGDQVTVSHGAARSVQSGKGRDGMAFSTFTAKGHDYVIPADAIKLVATGKLDRRLFDITTLVDFGYDDAHRATVPLIVSHPAGRAAPRAAKVTRELPSVNAVAMAADKSGSAWGALTAGATTRTTAAGVSKVWLDGKRKSTLDHSVPQIGAPAAWEAGFTGAGVKVAVLDTGVDQTHPDLADREVAEQNFSEAPDNVDNFGHGTHVASIVAGTGAKSGGKYRGVAWDASILDGKVLDDFGSGSESGIIAGMQWAAEQGADIANLSLGGGDSPEVDPLEEAVNTLSEQFGTLFVIAAGNSGPGEGTLGSPGTADAALTVGAVDDEDELADFSSRGPRLDGAIKPDITAPGVDIAAAKAANGQIGDPADDGYVTLSGTSMATPHVAGAAALIAQQHPDWTGAQLKAALTASALPNPGLSAFQQGSGRVDVAKTLTATVVSEPTSVSLGTVAWPHDDDQPVTKPLTYHNLGDTDVTLALSVEATGPDGAPADTFSLSTNEITVPAGGEAQVEVTGDTKKGTVDGAYSGAVVATAGESSTRTPVAVVREVESYDLTVNYADENGAPTADYSLLLVGLDNPTFAFPYDADGSVEVRLPKGQYVADHLVFTGGGAHYNMIAQPGLNLTGDMTVDVDATIAKPIDITPPAAADLLIGDIGYSVDTDGGGGFGSGFVTDDLGILSIAQLGEALPGTTVSGALNTQWLGADGSFYGLAFYPPGEFPTGFTKVVDQRELATVRADFGPAGEGQTGSRLMFPFPETGGGLVFGASTPVDLPGERTEYVTTEDVEWLTVLSQESADGEPTAEFDSEPRSHRSGRTYDERFGYATFAPGLPPTEFPWGQRFGDEIGVNVPMVSDVDGNAGYSIVDSASTKLFRGEELVGESPDPGYGVFTGLPAEAADYRLTSELTRSAPFDLSTAISTEWTFSSAHVDGEEAAAVDLNTVRLLPKLDKDNSAPRGKTFLVPMVLQDEFGVQSRARHLKVDASYDEGKTWQRVPVLLNLVAALQHPTDAESVSLRVSAADRDGNTVKETVIRAYKLRK